MDEPKRLADKIAKIRDQGRKALADIERKLADKVADIRAEECESIADTERRLPEKIAEIERRLTDDIANIRAEECESIADTERRLPEKIAEIERRLTGEIAKIRDDERKSVAAIERRLAKRLSRFSTNVRRARIERQFAAEAVERKRQLATDLMEIKQQFAVEAVESATVGSRSGVERERRWADEAVENARQFAAEAVENARHFAAESVERERRRAAEAVVRKRQLATENAERSLADRIADIELRLANRSKDVSWKLLERRLLDTLVGELGLSARSSNCLRKRNIRTIGDLISRTEGEIAQIRNLGPKSLAEIKLRLSRRGLGLGNERMSPDTPVVDLVFPDEITQYLDDLGGLIPSIDDDESFDRLIRLESAAAFNFKEELVNAISSMLSPTMPRLACFLERHRDGGSTTTVRNAGDSAGSCGGHELASPVTREHVRRVIAEAGSRLQQGAGRVEFAHWESSIAAAGDELPKPVRSFLAPFGFEGPESADDAFRMLETGSEVFGLDFPFEMRLVEGFGSFVVGRDSESKLRRTAASVKRTGNRRGSVCEELVQSVLESAVRESGLLRIEAVDAVLEWIAGDGGRSARA